MCAAWQQIFSGIAAFLVSGFVDPAIDWSLVSSASILGLGFLIFFGGVIAFSAYAYLLKHTRPALATSYAFVNPVLAVALGAFFVGETLSWLLILAMLAILIGVALIFFGQNVVKKISSAK
jgi:drug/metabolite transporter (DMT)-like permease